MQAAGHRVLITGGAKGIGLALAKQFYAAGNQVILIGRDEVALHNAVASMPGTKMALADIANATDRQRLVAQFADINILINNAGIQCNGQFSEQTIAEIENEIAINLIAPILLTHAFLPLLKAQSKAAIINVSSVLALVPKQSACIYSMSKAAIHSFTQSLRWQLQASQVRVLEIMPPLVETAMTANRGKGKISPDELATQFWRDFTAQKEEIFIGKAKIAKLLHRLAPALLTRLLRNG